MIQDEFMLMNKKRDGIVSDGLLFWFDGRDELTGDFSAGYARTACGTDRVSGAEVNIYDGGSGIYNQITQEDGFVSQYNASPSSRRNAIWSISSPVDGVRTVEIVIEKHPSLTEYWAAGFTSRSVTDSKNVALAGSVLSNVINSGERTHLIASLRNGEIVAFSNGEKITAESSAESIDIQNVVAKYDGVSALSLRTQTDVKIGCVRFYDRPLSDAEMLRNYDYEKSIGRVS